jgi:hypothetical protein
MERLFFHNREDALSRSIVSELPDDVRIYDVFGDDRYNLPREIKLTRLPYMVDKYLYTDLTAPITVGTVAIVLQCRNYLNEPLSDNQRFVVTINGKRYSIKSEDGLIKIEIECDEPTIISLQATGENYLPFSIELEVTDNVED